MRMKKMKRSFGKYVSEEIDKNRRIRSKVNFKKLLNEVTLNFEKLDDPTKLETLKTGLIMMLNLLYNYKDIQNSMDKLD